MTSLFRITRLMVLMAVMLCVATVATPSAYANSKYASFVVDAHSGKVLRARNADKRLYPASLTKMMTLYMAFEAIEAGRFTLDSPLKVSRNASREPASKLGLKAGQTITMRDAIQSCATKSANDAATVIAEAIGGSESEFARMMTRKARSLGMKNTQFKNAHGLTKSGQYSTARDMANLGQRIFSEFPQYYPMFKRKSVRYKGRKLRATNKLLSSYRGADGIKTGYTRASGFNLVASAERDGRRVIGVVFGGKSSKRRDRHMRRILDEGFAKLPKRPAMPAPQLIAVSPLPRPNPRYTSRPADIVVAAAPAPVLPAKSAPRALVAMRSQSDPWVVANGLRALQRIIAPEPRQKAAQASGEWAVQVGAFRKQNQAERMLEKAKALRSPQLVRAEPMISRRVKNGRAMYRARFSGLARGQAENACRSLARRGIACFAIQEAKI